MNDVETPKTIIKRPDYKFTLDFIISKVMIKEGKISVIGKTFIGLIGSLIVLFFFMLGYSFIYGVYLGDNKSCISILDIGLNFVPIDTKFVISMGILILILTTIFIIPIRNVFTSQNFKMKIISIFFIFIFSGASIYIFKLVLIGEFTTFNSNDLFLILAQIGLPLIIFSSAYIGEFITDIKSVIIIIISVLIVILIDGLIIILLKRMNGEIASILGISFTTMVSIIIYIVKSVLKIGKGENKACIRSRGNKLNLNIYIMLMVFLVCFIAMIMVSIANFIATLGGFYGQYYVDNGKQVITYTENNEKKRKVGQVIGCKDNNYYISEYPNKNLVIIKSSEVIVETHVTGWQRIDEKWYYFNSKGAILKNDSTPDGYKVDQTGAWIR